jgi:hypothetical protein
MLVIIIAILSIFLLYFIWQKRIPHILTKERILAEIERNTEGEAFCEEIRYSFPNQVLLSDFKLKRENLSILADALIIRWEFKPGFPKRLILIKPNIFVRYYRIAKRGSLPSERIFIKDGRVEIEKIGEFTRVSGSLKDGRIQLKGYGFGGEIRLFAERDEYRISLSDCSLFSLSDLSGDLVYRDREVFGEDISFRYRRLAFEIDSFEGSLSENLLSGNIKGRFYYQKLIPFRSTFCYQDGSLKVEKLCFGNLSLSGEITPSLNLSIEAEGEDLGLFGIKGASISGTATLKDNMADIAVSKMAIFGHTLSFSLLCEKEEDTISISTDEVFADGVKVAERVLGTVSVKDNTINSCFLNISMLPFFEKAEVFYDKDLHISLYQKGGGKVEMSGMPKRAELKIERIAVANRTLSSAGRLSFAKGKFRLSLSDGSIDKIPLNSLDVSFTIKDGINIEELKATLDRITSIYASGFFTEDEVNIEILSLNMRLSHIAKRLGEETTDFKGRLLGSPKSPALFGQLYSPSFRADFAMIDKKITLRNGRMKNTFFEADLDLTKREIEGVIWFEREDLYRTTSFLLLPQIADGELYGTATLRGSFSNPQILGTITLWEPTLFEKIKAERADVEFSLHNNELSIKEFFFFQEEGFGTGTALIETERGCILAEAGLCNFKIAQTPFTGLLSFSGSYTDGAVKGFLKTEGLLLAERYMLPNLVSRVWYKPKSLRFECRENGISGKIEEEEIDLSLVIDREKVLSISGMLDLKKRRCDLTISVSSLSIAHIGFLLGTGKVDGRISVCGEIENPEINGEFSLKADSLRVPIVSKIEDVVGRFKIEDGFLRIESFSGRIKESHIIITSSEKLIPERLKLSIRTEGPPIPVEIPGLLSGFAKIDIRVVKEGELPFGKGRIELFNTRFTYPPIRREKKVSPYLKNILYNTKIFAKHYVVYYNQFAEVEVEEGSWILLSSEDGETEIEGEAWAKRGRVEYLGTDFELRSAHLQFRGGVPYLYAEAETTASGVLILLQHRGELRLPLALTLSAPEEYPPKTQDEIAKLLQFGERKGSKLQDAIASLLAKVVGKRITKEATRQIRELLRADLELITPFAEKVFYEDSPKYEYALVGTELRLGKYLTDKVYLIYDGLIEEYKEERYILRHRIGFEYRLGHRTSARFLYTPKEEKEEEDYEFSIKKGIRF